jgi:pterin-4a-carbinolamine dehydratase
VRYHPVIITLSTHDAGGLTASDVTLAAQIDALAG